MECLKGVVIGAGYFSQFHYQAWQELPHVRIIALSDLDSARSQAMAHRYKIANVYTDYKEMLVRENPDFVDVVTPPETHLEIGRFIAELGIPVICQKPLAPTYKEAQELVTILGKKSIPFMVHENFRFQPWHREIKKLLDDDKIGPLNHLHFRMRTGDGWPVDAYRERQPYFRSMPRFLMYETGIHFIDTFRFLAGEVEWVFAHLRKLNLSIAGEDWSMVHFNFQEGSTGLFDANRYNEANVENPRYTFGEMLVEGLKGSIRLYGNGKITLQPLGAREMPHSYQHKDQGFAGNCVYHTQKHFLGQLIAGKDFETAGKEYLRNLLVQEAIYRSAQKNEVVKVQ